MRLRSFSLAGRNKHLVADLNSQYMSYLNTEHRRRCSVFFLIMVSCCGVASSLYAVIILVHGSHANHEHWFRPQGDFYQALQKGTQRKQEFIVPFGWTGETNSDAIKAAGELLGCLLLSYGDDEEITIIGHSNGGNVALAASQWFDSTRKNYAAQKKLLFPDRVLGAFEALYKVLRSTPLIEVINQRYRRSYLIDRLFLLGTPITEEAFSPDLSKIGFVCNIFSYGDAIQPLVGRQTLSKQPRVINVSVQFRNVDFVKMQQIPSHTELHHPLIGASLFAIPEVLLKECVNQPHLLEEKIWQVCITPESIFVL